jgi:hypothetical protein
MQHLKGSSDGSWSSDPQFSRYHAVGEGCLAPAAAEAMALLQAIRFCRDEGDAKSVIDSVHSDMVYSSGVGHLIEDIKFEIQASQQWKLTFIKREGNMFRIVDAEMFLLIIFVMFCC